MRRARRWSGALAVLAVTTAVPPAVAADVPPRFEALVERQPDGGSDAMFAQIVVPKVKGYRWTIDAYKESPSSKTILTFRFSRSAARGTQHQSSRFTWQLPRGALKMDSDLKPASLVTGKSMGGNGSIAMRLTDTQAHGRLPAEQGCSGSISYRMGRFGGRLRFNARDEFFKRISVQGAPVLLYRAHDYYCPPEGETPLRCPEGLSLIAAEAGLDVIVGAFKTPEGKVDQLVVANRKLGTADTEHTISVSIAVPESFEASDDLTTASVDGNAAGPWLSGDLDYVGPLENDGVDESCGPYESSGGVATGDYTAHFDSIGPVTPASTGVTATLRQEI